MKNLIIIFLKNIRYLYNLTKNNLYFNNNNNNNLKTKNKIIYYINILKYNNEKDYKIKIYYLQI